VEAPGQAQSIGELVALTQELYGEIERELKLVGFWESIPARNKLVADLQKAILQPEFAKMPGLIHKRKHIISRLLEIAEKNHDTILYAH
jgi:type I restriction enzyme R subunit